MKICITTPNRYAPNGGVKLITDLFEQLKKRGHECYLLDQNTMTTDDEVINPRIYKESKFDLTIVCSPHSAWTLQEDNADRKIVWAQMAEHLWNGSSHFQEKCDVWYNHDNIIVNSKWLLDFMPNAKVCRTWLQDTFVPPMVNLKYDILLESPFSNNRTKDVDQMAYQAAQYLQRKYRARVIGYGRKEVHYSTLKQYVARPPQETLMDMYCQSRILLKATKFDGAACAPIEAARCGCVTVRAIDRGDDHLTNEWAYRCTYDYDNFLHLAEAAYLNTNTDKIQKAMAWVKGWTFDNFIKEFNTLANVTL